MGSNYTLIVLLKYRPSECRLGGMSSNWMSAPWNRLGDCRLTECRLSDRYPSKQVPLPATPVTGFQHPIKLSLINIQFQIMLNVVPKTSY